MKIVKLFDANEIAEATGIRLEDIVDFPNDCAIRWWVELEEIESDMDDIYKEEIVSKNKITEYIISQGAKEGEVVWIDVTW